MSERALVTGGGGFIGRHLVGLLIGRGAKVRILDLDPGTPPGQVEALQGSILDRALVARAVQGVDVVYHLAGNPNLWSPRGTSFLEVNTRGTQVVLDASIEANVKRFVYTSTESTLRLPQTNGVFVEGALSRSSIKTPGPYCNSKQQAEDLTLRAAAQGHPVVVVNPTLPVGPGDRSLTPPTRMLLGFLRGEFPAYLDCCLNYVDVRDVALGHILAAERGRVGERYILGGESLWLRDVLDMLRELTGRPMPRWRTPYWLAYVSALISETWATHVSEESPVATLTGVRLARTPMVSDCSRTFLDLGHSPRPIRQSFSDAIDWLESNGHLLVDRLGQQQAPGDRVGRDQKRA